MDFEKIDWDRIPRETTRPLQGSDLCGLGKFKNTPLSKVPESFFLWMIREQEEAPRVNRGWQWVRVLNYYKNKSLN
jgi:hypothetical protein